MGFFSKDIRTMDDLFVQTLQDIYYAEQKILQSLPVMIENSSNPKLKAAFEHHMAETQNHVRRVEQVFEMCNSKPEAVNWPAIDGIIQGSQRGRRRRRAKG
jgi:ferritin-like metal-binding protein YciE